MNESSQPVRYSFTISLIVFTYQGHSAPVRAEEASVLQSLPYSILTLFFGWWGFPWGPIKTIQSLVINFSGGKPAALQDWSPAPAEPVLAAASCPSCGSGNISRAFGKGICNLCKTRW